MTKRHAKPTALQLINRLYRQSLANTRDVENQLAIIRLDLQESRLRAKTVKTLIDHCARLLKEKETLMRQVYAVKELKESARDNFVVMHMHAPGDPCSEYCRSQMAIKL
jgi:hypothetical protein